MDKFAKFSSFLFRFLPPFHSAALYASTPSTELSFSPGSSVQFTFNFQKKNLEARSPPDRWHTAVARVAKFFLLFAAFFLFLLKTIINKSHWHCVVLGQMEGVDWEERAFAFLIDTLLASFPCSFAANAHMVGDRLLMLVLMMSVITILCSESIAVISLSFGSIARNHVNDPLSCELLNRHKITS